MSLRARVDLMASIDDNSGARDAPPAAGRIGRPEAVAVDPAVLAGGAIDPAILAGEAINPAILAGQWARVRARLKEELGEAVYRSWFRDLELLSLCGGELMLRAGSPFSCEQIRSRYGDTLRTLWRRENAAVTALVFRTDPLTRAIAQPARAGQPNEPARAGQPNGPARAGQAAGSANVGQPAVLPGVGTAREPDFSPARPWKGGAAAAPLPDALLPAEAAGLDLGDAQEEVNGHLDPRLTFENFVVGKPNELAHAAARRVAEFPAAPGQTVPFNPLFLYGGVGLGKTHLMHAIAWGIRRQDPSRRVIYLSAEKFMYRFIRALRFRDTMSFKEQFRSVDVLMIDDVQFISGKDSTQEEFFHTFNALVDQNKQIIISADKSPSDLEGIEERMKSRLGWGMVADIHPTTYELRLGILQAKADQMNLAMPPRVLEFIAHKITANVRELEGALTRIRAHAQLVGREITLETTQDVLHDVLRANDKRLTIEDIQKKVAEYYKIRLADMHSARRARAVARPRQVAMYLCKQLTPRSLPEIGRKFGGRDHTTVIHAVRTIEALAADDKEMAEDVELLRRMLGG